MKVLQRVRCLLSKSKAPKGKLKLGVLNDREILMRPDISVVIRDYHHFIMMIISDHNTLAQGSGSEICSCNILILMYVAVTLRNVNECCWFNFWLVGFQHAGFWHASFG